MKTKHLLSLALAAGLSCLTGCSSSGLSDYNEKVTALAGTGAGKISLVQSSNFHSVSMDLVAGEVFEFEDGSQGVSFEHVAYTQSNPIWNTKIIVEDYLRVIPTDDVEPVTDAEAAETEPPAVIDAAAAAAYQAFKDAPSSREERPMVPATF